MIDKELMKKLYFDDKLTIEKTAKILYCSPSTVYREVKKIGKTRNTQQALKVYFEKKKISIGILPPKPSTFR